jgi:type II pantothenate kinase
MRTTIGIDIGGSATKIVCFREAEDGTRTLLPPMFARATDPLTSVYGAFGKFLASNGLSLADIDSVKITGVGSTHIGDELYSLPCHKVAEFDALGLGGLYLSGLDEAVVVSMGTGTAIVLARKGQATEYLGGTGVGGGTLRGLSRLLLQMDSLDHVAELSEQGDLSHIDLLIGDIMKGGKMPKDLTAANFGNVSDLATREDIALAILNLVCETVGMLALFAARAHNVKDIVLTGKLSSIPSAKRLFAHFAKTFGINILIPDNAPFGTVIGAALCEA